MITTTYLEKTSSFLEPLVPYDTPPVFASDRERKVTSALCSMYSGNEYCNPELNPYGNSLLKRYQAIAPEPLLTGTLLFRFGENLYAVECVRNSCKAYLIPEQEGTDNVAQQVIEKDSKDSKNLAPLLMAVSQGDKELVASLLVQGADVNARNKDGWTALMEASVEGNAEIAKILIENGGDVNAKNDTGSTALSWATSEGHKKIAELLIAKGADVSARDNHGATALMVASEERNMGIVRMLIKNGADVNAKDKYGDTALKLAAKYEHPETVKFLKRHGAK